MSIRKWIIIFLVFSLTIPLSIAAFNIYTDFDMIFNYPNSVHLKYIKQAVTALNQGDFLVDHFYHINQGSVQRQIHLATNNPDILLFGTSRLMLLNSSHIPNDKLKFMNSSIHGGGVSGIIEAWQQYKERIPNHKASYAFIEVYPLLHLKTLTELLIYFANIHLDEISQQQILDHIKESKTLAREHLFSSSYFFKNIYHLTRPNFSPSTHLDNENNFITSDGSYILSSIVYDEKEAINHGLDIQRMQPKDMPALPLIKALALDILAHDIIPILILPPYHPIAYDLATDGNDLLQTIEADVLAFAQEHDIMVVGSFNPHPYNLDASYFRNANHSTAAMWEVLFADFTFPEPLKIDDQ